MSKRITKWLWIYREKGPKDVYPWNLNTFYYTESEAKDKFKDDNVDLKKAKWTKEKFDD